MSGICALAPYDVAWACSLGCRPPLREPPSGLPCGRKHRIASTCCRSSGSTEDLVNLGQSPLRVSRLGIGTLQWGDPGSGFGESFGEDNLSAAFNELVAGGINFFDSAEVYGYQNIKSCQSSEQLLGRFVMQAKEGPPPVITSKFFTIPWSNLLVGGGFRFGKKSLIAALRASLQRLGTDQVDLYQIHFPFPTISNATLMDGLKEAMDLGLTRAVGVSNYSASQMEEAHRLLAANGIPLASNQVRFSLLSQLPEEEGLLQVAKDLGVSIIAYSPLATGLLTDKSLTRRNRQAVEAQPLLKLMASIGRQHGDKSISQVALNYLVCKGVIPIPGCKTVEQARSQLGVLGWRLDSEDVASLEGKAKAFL